MIAARKGSPIRTKVADFVFHSVNYSINFLFLLLCLYPFLYLVFVSLSDPVAVGKGDVVLWPVGFTLQYYGRIMKTNGIYNAVLVSVARTVAGTAICVFFNAMMAYVVTKKEFKWRTFYYRALILTMYMSSSLIPYFLTTRWLGVYDTFFVYILPGAVSAFNVVLVKTYIESLPVEMEESALIDGAGYFQIFTRIILPLSKPILATIAVFGAVGQWNSFSDTFFFTRSQSLQTLQFILYRFMREADAIAQMMKYSEGMFLNIPLPSPFTVKCAISVMTILPIALVYPFLQKYFVGGIMLGAVKG